MYTVRAFAANVEVVNTSGVETVVSSRAVSLGFGVQNDAAERHKLFEAAFNDLDDGVGTIADPSIIKVTHFSNAGLDAETGRTVARDIPLFVIALNLVVVFLGLTLGRTRRLGGVLPVPDLVGGRWLLAWTALMSVGLAAGTGFGLTGLLGGTFHSVVSLLPLIALGVQVDDCVITVNQLALVPSSMATASIADRFAHSLRESGPCITTTSLTTCVAFAVGISASLPGVSYFCMYATAVFFFGWFFQVTFFYACVVLDERRIVRRGCCALPCVTVGGGGAAADAGATSSAKGAEEGRQDGSAFQQAMSRFARLLLHPAAALCVAIAFSGAAGAAGALVHRIPVGLPLEDILPDDSYIREAFAVEEAVFNGRTAPITVVVKGADFELASARQAFRDAVSGVGALDFALAMPAHWMDAYEAWTAAQGTNFSTYLGGMAQFLTADGATKWQAHVQCADASCAALRSAKFTVLAHTSRPGETVLDELSVRDDIDQVLGRSYAASETVTYALPFMFAETDQRTWAAVLSSIGLALAGVFVVMCLSTSPLIALWVSLCVAMIDAELLLVAYLWGMQLNSITYTCLVMACGLAVDYCVHIGHAFEHALHADPAIAPKEAAQTAIVRMGASVFKGASPRSSAPSSSRPRAPSRSAPSSASSLRPSSSASRTGWSYSPSSSRTSRHGASPPPGALQVAVAAESQRRRPQPQPRPQPRGKW